MPANAKNKICVSLISLSGVLLMMLSLMATAAGMVEAVNKKKELIVGVALSEPRVMKDRSGELLGYDIEVARQLANDLSVSVKFQLLAMDQLLDELLAGRIDIIISGMTITTPRNLKANFTIPYSDSGIQLLANKQATRVGFNQTDDFNRVEVSLAVVKATLAESIAKELFPLAQQEKFKDEQSALNALKNGKVTAMLAATPFPEQQVARHPDVLSMPLPRKLRRTSEAFMIRKEDPDSLNVLNNWIFQRIADGWLPGRHDYWFTTAQWRSRL